MKKYRLRGSNVFAEEIRRDGDGVVVKVDGDDWETTFRAADLRPPEIVENPKSELVPGEKVMAAYEHGYFPRYVSDESTLEPHEEIRAGWQWCTVDSFPLHKIRPLWLHCALFDCPAGEGDEFIVKEYDVFTKQPAHYAGDEGVVLRVGSDGWRWCRFGPRECAIPPWRIELVRKCQR
jgi:hypothetical protein